MSTMSWRDKTDIRKRVSDGIVDRVCSGLINTGQQLIPGLRTTLGNSIVF